MKLSKLFIPIALVCSLNVSFAQEADKETSSDGGSKNLGAVFNGASISASAGMNVYFGDLAAYNLFPRPKQFREHVTAAFKASIARDIKWGLGAQFNYQVGSLIGTRKTGRFSTTVSFENDFYDLSFQINYLLNDALFKKNEYNRFKLYANVGVGSIWFRSQLYDPNTLDTKDSEGFIEIENTQGVSQKNLSDKTSKARASTIVYGFKLSYKLNYKTDLHLDFTQTAANTDRLDAFGRGFSSRDKYDYIGIGLTFNFNRTEEDAPKKKPKKEKTKKDAYDNGSSENNNNNNNGSSANSDNIRRGIFSRKNRARRDRRNGRDGNNEDQLLNIRLKLFETQLKLFEMQYLIGK